MNTVTQRFRKGLHAIEPLCGLTGFSSEAELRVACGVRISQVDESCQASNVAGQRRAGRGLPKMTDTLPSLFVQKAGWPSGKGGCFGLASDFVQSSLSRSKFSAPSFHTQRPHS